MLQLMQKRNSERKKSRRRKASRRWPVPTETRCRTRTWGQSQGSENIHRKLVALFYQKSLPPTEAPNIKIFLLFRCAPDASADPTVATQTNRNRMIRELSCLKCIEIAFFPNFGSNHDRTRTLDCLSASISCNQYLVERQIYASAQNT